MAHHPHDPLRPESKRVMAAIESGDMEVLYHALTVRRRRFCEEYSIDFNGKAAAIRAGFSINGAEQQARTLLADKGVSTYINHLTESKTSKIVSVNPDYIIQQITAIISKDNARDGDKLRGLELLARHLGMFIERTEITGKDGGPLSISQKAEEDAKSFTLLLEQLADRAKKEPNLGQQALPLRLQSPLRLPADGKGL